MAQHDYDIANQSFPSFRSDLNSVLEAINTSNSGNSRPTSAVNGTIWLDTTNATTPTLKLYDGTDDISLATFDYSANTVNWLDSTVSADLVNDLSPQLGGMLDVNGNAIGNGTEELIKFSETASAVNEVTVTNSATGNAPEISATGDDTNIDFKLTPKGTGKLVLDGLNFPTADGTTGQFLKTDGSGNLSFDDAGGGSLNLISAQTASSASTLTFTSSHITSTYKVYQLHCIDVVQSSDGGNLGFEVSPDNGSSYVQSGYLNIRFYSNETNGANTILSSAGTGDSNVKICGAGEGVGANGNESAQSIITLFNPLGAKAKFFKCDGVQLNSSGQLSMQRHLYGLDQSATYNNIKIVPNSGTFSGTFILYGVTAS